MAQRNWIYVGDDGKKYNVGIFHGQKTGHVLIHCNLKILMIDFSVIDSKSYSFFLGEELCGIKLNRAGDKFFYDFDIDEEVDTPINRRRKATARRHWYQSIAFFGVMGICATIFSALFLNMKPAEPNHFYTTAGTFKHEIAEGIATVKEISSSKFTNIHYEFHANANLYRSDFNLEDENFKFWLPLNPGDQFKVKYNKYDPSENEIYLYQPSNVQIERYKSLVLEQHLSFHPQLAKSIATCEIEIAYNLKGIEGLADFYFQKTSDADNPLHNSNTFNRLVRDFPFKNNKQQNCWR